MDQNTEFFSGFSLGAITGGLIILAIFIVYAVAYPYFLSSSQEQIFSDDTPGTGSLGTSTLTP